jgi:hypothetical protein
VDREMRGEKMGVKICIISLDRGEFLYYIAGSGEALAGGND